jgi:hypothetical protein
VNRRPTLVFFVHRVEPDEVLLRVRRDLRRRPRDDEIP